MVPYTWFQLEGNQPSLLPKGTEIARYTDGRFWREPTELGMIPLETGLQEHEVLGLRVQEALRLTRVGEHAVLAWKRTKGTYRVWPLFLPLKPVGSGYDLANRPPPWAMRVPAPAVWTAYDHIMV